MSKAQNMSDLSRLVFAFDNHSMYNVWYENELVGWIMLAYTLLQNSSVSYRSLQVLFEHDRPRIGFLSWSVQVCRVALRAAGRRTRDEILIPPF